MGNWGLVGAATANAPQQTLEDLLAERMAAEDRARKIAADSVKQKIDLGKFAIDQNADARSGEYLGIAKADRSRADATAQADALAKSLQTADADKLMSGISDPNVRTVAGLRRAGITGIDVNDLRPAAPKPKNFTFREDASGLMAIDPENPTNTQRVPGFRPKPLNGGAPTAKPDDDQLTRAAQAVIEGKMAPSQAVSMYGGMGQSAAAFKRAMTDRIRQNAPDFNFQKAESDYSYGKNPGTQTTVRYLDNIAKTLPVLRKASEDFKRGGVRSLNALLASGQSQFGNTDIATFDFARTMLADEIAKVLQGGGTGSGTSDAKLKQASDLLARDMSAEQFEATLKTVEEMLSARRDTLTKGTYMDGQQLDAQKNGGVVELVRDPKTGKLVPKGGS